MDSGICGHTWNGGQCCFSFEDDENFLVDVLVRAKEAIAEAGIVNATSAPTFLFGFSAGSVMTHRMACTHSDLFKAAVTVSGTLNFPGKNLFCRVFQTNWFRSRLPAEKSCADDGNSWYSGSAISMDWQHF